jgi:hypothetical protein
VRLPDVVGVKPVPVSVITVPKPALVEIAAGDEDATVGPATEKAEANGALTLAPLATVTATGPEVAPVVTATGAVMVVPVLEVVALNVTSAVPATGANWEYWLKPVPVSVTGVVVLAEPTATGVVGAVAPVTIGATVLASPTDKAPATEA